MKQETENTPDKKEEARNLAQEAVEQMRDGNREEGKFLASEAEALDKASADEILKSKGSARSKAGGDDE